MKNRVKMLTVLLLGLLPLASCGGHQKQTVQARAVFYLEGGQCQNAANDRVTYVYALNDEEALTYIADPNALSEKDITKTGYSIEGWYRTKNISGDEITYEDRWEFQEDKIGIDGVTLYAKWVKDIVYTYDICYKDEQGNVTVVYSYTVNEGDEFKDLIKKVNTLEGHTALPGFYDENDQPWDDSFKHPGGETDTSIRVFAHYIEGEYTLVSTAKELLSSRNKPIYLLNDIDMEGQTLYFGDYAAKFQGNGHTISNFEIGFDSSNLTADLSGEGDGTFSCAYAGLFRKLTDAKIENVRFENGTLNVDTNYSKIKTLIVSPFASQMVRSSVSGVTFSCNLNVSEKTLNFVNNRNVVYDKITDRFAYLVDDESSVSADCQIRIEETGL